MRHFVYLFIYIYNKLVELLFLSVKMFQTTSTPWKEILCSKAVWAQLVASCGASWGSFTLMTQIPTYMENVLHFHIQDVGKYKFILLKLINRKFKI